MPDRKQTVQGQDALLITGGQQLRIGGASDTRIGSQLTLSVGGSQAVRIEGQARTVVGQDLHLEARSVTVQATERLELRCGAARIVLHHDGRIEILGQDVTLEAQGRLDVKGRADTVIVGRKVDAG
jgi:type VI secretion system secreted protein VgrG